MIIFIHKNRNWIKTMMPFIIRFINCTQQKIRREHEVLPGFIISEHNLNNMQLTLFKTQKGN